jgi:hypothetical protein
MQDNRDVLHGHHLQGDSYQKRYKRLRLVIVVFVLGKWRELLPVLSADSGSVACHKTIAMKRAISNWQCCDVADVWILRILRVLSIERRMGGKMLPGTKV